MSATDWTGLLTKKQRCSLQSTLLDGCPRRIGRVRCPRSTTCIRILHRRMNYRPHRRSHILAATLLRALERGLGECAICMGGNGGEGDNRRVSLLSCSHVFHENCVRSLELFCLSSTSATVPAVSEVRHSCSSGGWMECGSDTPPILALISHLAPSW